MRRTSHNPAAPGTGLREELTATRVRRHPDARSRLIGGIGVVSGLVGASVGLVKVLYPASVQEDRYSYPFDAFGFTVENLVLSVQHLGPALLAWGLWHCGAAGRSTLARVGATATVASWIGFAAVKVFAVTARNEPLRSSLAETVDGLSGLAGTSIGLSTILLGIAVSRAGIWTTWVRYLPLTLGLFVFVAVIPSIFSGSFILARLAIIAWMMLWAVLGWALARSNERID